MFVKYLQLVVFNQIGLGYVFHAANFQIYIVSTFDGIGHFFNVLFVHLHAVNLQARTGKQLFMTYVALEVFGLLMLKQYFLVFELSIAIPTPRLRDLLLFSAHSDCCICLSLVLIAIIAVVFFQVSKLDV